MPAGALYIRITHAEIAHGFVKSVDTSAAEAIAGVVKVITCFDMAVLHGGGIVPALDLDESGLLNGLLIISPADVRGIRTWPTATS